MLSAYLPLCVIVLALQGHHHALAATGDPCDTNINCTATEFCFNNMMTGDSMCVAQRQNGEMCPKYNEQACISGKCAGLPMMPLGMCVECKVDNDCNSGFFCDTPVINANAMKNMMAMKAMMTKQYHMMSGMMGKRRGMMHGMRGMRGMMQGGQGMRGMRGMMQGMDGMSMSDMMDDDDDDDDFGQGSSSNNNFGNDNNGFRNSNGRRRNSNNGGNNGNNGRRRRPNRNYRNKRDLSQYMIGAPTMQCTTLLPNDRECERSAECSSGKCLIEGYCG